MGRGAGAGSAESPGTRGIFDAEGVALTFCAAFEAIDRRRVVGFGAGGDSVDEGATVNFDVLSNDTDADAPGDTFTVTEVNGLAGQVGNAVALEVGGIVVGDLTVNADGSASFVTTSDLTVEIFSVSANYTMNDGGASPQTGTIDITINPQDDNAPFLSAAGLALEGTTLLQYDEDSILVAGTPAGTEDLTTYFHDLDIDADAEMDDDSADDNDSLVFSLVGNTNAFLVNGTVSGRDLDVYTSCRVAVAGHSPVHGRRGSQHRSGLPLRSTR